MATAATTKPADIGTLEKLMRFVWGDPDNHIGKDGSIRQIERAISAIRGFSILGLIPVMVYGAIAGTCSTTHCVSVFSDTFDVLRGMSVALLAAISAFASGAVLGFLFGLPRWGESAPGQQNVAQQPALAQTTATTTTPTTGTNTDADGKAAEPTIGLKAEQKEQTGVGGSAPSQTQAASTTQSSSPTAGISARLSRVRPNTGLEKVMDWLTTLIVGLSLVHLRDAIFYVRKTSEWVTAAIAGNAGLEPPTNFAAGAAILLPYGIAGFFLVYLWAQRYMGREMALADHESQLLEEAKQQMEEKNKKALAAVADVTEDVLNRIPSVSAAQMALTRVEGLSESNLLDGIDPATQREINDRYKRAHAWADEPMEGFGPLQSGTLRIDANVRRVAEGMPLFEVTLNVKSVDDGRLEGEVVFFLHHTLAIYIRRVQAVNNVAKLAVHCTGTFIAGALVISSGTKLAINLADLPGVPQDFINN